MLVAMVHNIFYKSQIRVSNKEAKSAEDTFKENRLLNLPLEIFVEILKWLPYKENSIPNSAIYRLNKSTTRLISTSKKDKFFRIKKYLPSKVDFGSEVTDNHLFHLQHRNLTHLVIRNGEKITDEGIGYLNDLPLQQLCIRANYITDKGLAGIKKLHKLKELDLICSYNITGSGFFHFSGFKDLEILTLTFCKKLTDRGLFFLQNLPKLKILNLQVCRNISDTGLAYLQKLPLVHLVSPIYRPINPYSKVSTQAIELLQKTNPNLVISLD